MARALGGGTQDPDRSCAARSVASTRSSLLEYQVRNLLDEYTRSQGRHRGLAGELLQRRTGHGSEIGYPPDVVCTDPSVEVRGSMLIESFPIALPFPDIR